MNSGALPILILNILGRSHSSGKIKFSCVQHNFISICDMSTRNVICSQKRTLKIFLYKQVELNFGVHRYNTQSKM